MIYQAIECERATLELVKQALLDAAVAFDDMAVDSDREDSRHPDKTRLRLGDEGLHVKGQRGIEYRDKARRIRDFWQQLV